MQQAALGGADSPLSGKEKPLKTISKRFPRTVRLAALAAVLMLASYRSWSQANGGPCAPTGNETMQADAHRYQPGQTVLVTGSGYQAGCNLTLTVGGPASVSTLATTGP